MASEGARLIKTLGHTYTYELPGELEVDIEATTEIEARKQLKLLQQQHAQITEGTHEISLADREVEPNLLRSPTLTRAFSVASSIAESPRVHRQLSESALATSQQRPPSLRQLTTQPNVKSPADAAKAYVATFELQHEEPWL